MYLLSIGLTLAKPTSYIIPVVELSCRAYRLSHCGTTAVDDDWKSGWRVQLCLHEYIPVD